MGATEGATVHHLRTPLHLAFSCYVFTSDAKLLLTMRSDRTRTWPGIWTNSCYGKRRPGEPVPAAVTRTVRARARPGRARAGAGPARVPVPRDDGQRRGGERRVPGVPGGDRRTSDPGPGRDRRLRVGRWADSRAWARATSPCPRGVASRSPNSSPSATIRCVGPRPTSACPAGRSRPSAERRAADRAHLGGVGADRRPAAGRRRPLVTTPARTVASTVNVSPSRQVRACRVPEAGRRVPAARCRRCPELRRRRRR